MKNRLPEIDLARGLAVIGMIIFHFFFIMDYYGILDVNLYHGFWLILARYVQFSFLGLVGISLAISNKQLSQQWKRAAIIFGMGLIITGFTHFFTPEAYVRFGILHLIGFSIFALSPLRKKRYISLTIAVAAILASIWIKTVNTNNLVLIILGATGINFTTLDYFPILPWISVVAIGVFIGDTLYLKRKPLMKTEIKTINYLGRHSLLIYMFHIPLIILILLALNVLSFQNFL